MTEAEALVVVRAVTAEAIRVDPDLLTFGGYHRDEIIAGLRSARRCQGDGSCFVIDGRFTVLVDATGAVVVIGAARR